ncbi:Tryptophan--tRNA ligase, mitochondrial [Tulasnella sp. 330]|nr:Tryptophan--tRNA ligase, mitochondrial [Tulasnella sp. 330]KAG8885966.1 Tryptophan--tRNA ligase, mitochondrial [Tulasnella sp. 331]KAG8888817.1 Tryptophan--tRNA ligase, mitochondrial [Tulasnella sp. 332]
MGSAASKAGRKLPVKPSSPSWAGARSDPAVRNAPRTTPAAVAQSSKTPDTKWDGGDPHLLANLTALGAVRVPSAHMVPAPGGIAASMKARQLSEEQAVGRAPQNRLLASTLINLLDERRTATLNGTALDVDALCNKYNIDPQVLSRVIQCINRHRFYSSSPVQTLAEKRVIFSGIQPTGVPHLGNLLGALSNWVDLQDSAQPGDTVLYSTVGYHAITLPQNPEVLLADRRNLLASLLAVGLDPKKSIIFSQDQVPEHTELAWILNCITPLGKLQRMTTWKESVIPSILAAKLVDSRNANSEKEINDSMLHLGLFAYPVLQAADVLMYKATHVPVGEDQEQHLELCRDLADLFNRIYDKPKTVNTFPVPQHLISPAKRVMSLRNPQQKMSKSAPDPRSRILISDSTEEISSKIRSAVTDSIPTISYDPLNRPGVSNLLTILAAVISSSSFTLSAEALANEYQGKDHASLKADVTDAIVTRLRPIRDNYLRLKDDEAWLNVVSRTGVRRAREIAVVTMDEVKQKIGIGPL